MFFHTDIKILSTKGKAFLNEKILDDILKFLPEATKKNNSLDKILSFFSTKKKQQYIRRILYKEVFLLQLQLKHNIKNTIKILNEGNIKQLKMYIQSNQDYFPGFLLYCLDYIIDEYNIDIFNGNNKINIDDISLALAFVYLKEVIFYVLLNSAELKMDKNTISILPTPELKTLLKKRWMAINWDKSSFEYSSVLNHKIFMEGGVNNINDYIKSLSTFLFDRVFYFNKNYIHHKNFELEALIYMNNLCIFFAYLLYGYYSKSKIHLKNNKRFSQIGLDNDFLNLIIYESNLKTNLNKGFKIKGNNISFIDGTAYDYVMRMYFNDYMKSKNKNTFNQKKGFIFEEYIFNYINSQKKEFENYDIYRFDKTFTDEIDEKKIKLDIDFILVDKVRKKYFLIQAKHSTYAKAYLKEEVYHYCNSKDLIDKGVKQLNSFSYFYNKDNKLKIELEQIGLSQINLDNTHLILLHTMPLFDFQQIENVILYDWNSFRNILQYGLRFNTAQNLHELDSITQSSEVLEIEKLDETIEYLLNSTIIEKDKKITLKDNYTFFEHVPNYIQTRNYRIETIIN